MIMNVLNDAWSDTYILHIIIQKRIDKKPDKLYGDKLEFKNIKFPVKVRDIDRTKRKISIGISVFGYENKKKNIQSMCQ